jgi:hypothetical protein
MVLAVKRMKTLIQRSLKIRKLRSRIFKVKCRIALRWGLRIRMKKKRGRRLGMGCRRCLGS